MHTLVTNFESGYRKTALPKVQSGDTVRVHQKVREAGKERAQIFEGTVIRTRRLNSLTASITVRRLSSGVGVEKTYLMHSPNVEKIQVVKRGKVRRNYLTYLRARQGKATRLTEVGFDHEAVNVKEEPKPKATKADTKPETEEKPIKTEKETKEGKEGVKTETKAADKEAGEPVYEAKEPPKEDKAAVKKAKAEAFRKAQEVKQK